MNKNGYRILFAVLIVMLSGIGMVAAQDGVKCVWEPCGTKVEQADIDAVYALMKDDQIRIVYGDVNSDGKYNIGETIYVDMVQNGNIVEQGDIRLSKYHDLYMPNTKVFSTEADKNNPIREFPCGQAVIGFVDVNNDNVYDLGDALYVDTDCDSRVSVGDLRLTERKVNTKTYEPYTIVETSDWDVNNDLRDPVTYSTNITTLFWTMVGYIDSDCSADWSCPDKLYLQQIMGDLRDEFVTIGDLRLYVPPEAITIEGWPKCGTRVHQGDIDAVYVLTMDEQIRIMYGDINSNGEYDPGETIYVDMYLDLDQVEAGDIRLSPYHDYPANTKVVSTEIDKNNPLRELPTGQFVIGYVDVNNNGVYDVADPLYVDTDGDFRVSVGDLRLTKRTAMTETYAPYTVVEDGDFDAILNDQMLDIAFNTPFANSPFWGLVGYIDSDCSGDWTCPDKLYLQQIRFDIGDLLVTIGDLRLYIPPEAMAADEWPACGTKVEQCDIDAVYVLTQDSQIRIMYGDTNSNNRYDIGETVYVDMERDFNEVEEGDVRLTWYHDEYPPNTKVFSMDIDKNNPLKELPNGQAVVGYVDLNNDGTYDIGDSLYVDTDGSSTVTKGDVRLSSRMANGVTYAAYTVVNAGDWDLIGNTDLKDPVTDSTNLTTQFWMLVGYIDSDCSGDWTCPDKLYLQQLWADGETDGQFVADLVVTIGDLRLYIPPGEIAPGQFNEYDANENCKIDMGELGMAIEDWFDGTLEMGDLGILIEYWFDGSYPCS